MENLNQIKNSISEMELQLDALKAQLESAEEKNDCTYSFTQDEMIQFVKKLHDEFETSLKRSARSLDYEDAINLDLYDRQIEINVDSEQITDIIISEMDFNNDDDDILVTITNIVTAIKNEQ